jgi:3-methyladenine DNA glycosylase/8-oxoguanine DNA glycosylase
VPPPATVDGPLERRLELRTGANPLKTMAALWLGPSDPQMSIHAGRIARAMHLATGPATIQIEVGRAHVFSRAWGPGAAEALELLPGLVGELDDPSPLVPRHPLVAKLARQLNGVRLTRGVPVMDALVVSVLGQKVTMIEARSAHRLLLLRHGQPAPGPLSLRLPPPPEKLARLPYWAFHPLGVERRRAETIRAAAAAAPRLRGLNRLTPAEAARRLRSIPGVGPWTAAETTRLALGDPDAVSVGDYNLPRLVCWALTGRAEGDDERMLELLEPYRGQRARVILLIERSGLRPPRHGSRFAPRAIATM